MNRFSDSLARIGQGILGTSPAPQPTGGQDWSNSGFLGINSFRRDVGLTPYGPVQAPASLPQLPVQAAVTPQVAPLNFNFSNPASRPVSFPARPTYSTEPAALTSQQLAQLDSLRINADEDLAMAKANREKALQQLDTNFIQNTGQLARAFNNQREDAGRQLMSSMSGFSPGTAGRVVRAIRDAQAAKAAQIRDVRTQGIASLDQMVNQSEINRNKTIADIARQRAALSGNYQSLLPGVAY